MELPFILLSGVMMLMATISCAGDELIKAVFFSTVAIWIVLVGVLFKEG